MLHTYNKGYVIQYEKQESSKLLFLIEGLAKAYKIDRHDNEVFLFYIHKNSLLSEVSSPYSDILSAFSNIEIVEESKVLCIDYQRFKENFLDQNVLCMTFASEILARLDKLQNLINREFKLEAVAKVSMLLYTDLEMFNRLKRHDISSMLCIQPATLSRVLNQLKQENIIDIDHGEIVVIEPLTLEEHYNEFSKMLLSNKVY